MDLKKGWKRTIGFLCVVSLLLFAGCGNQGGQSADSDPLEGYPDRPLTIIVPYAAGGGGDIQARIIANYLQEQLGQTVNVVAKPGGAGAVGMNEAKKAAPDGYTIILSALGPATLAPHHSDVGYNTPEDFEAISQISLLTYGVAVHADSGITTLDELLTYTKEHPGTVFATPNAGLHQHLIMEQFLQQFPDISVELVPFNGGAEAVSALLGQHVLSSMNVLSELYPHYQAGTFHILAVTDAERNQDFPNTPTFAELDYEDVPLGAWFGFLAPKGTPQEIVDYLDQTIKAALEDETVKDQFAKASLTISYLNAADFKAVIEKDWEENGTMIKQLQEAGAV